MLLEALGSSSLALRCNWLGKSAPPKVLDMFASSPWARTVIRSEGRCRRHPEDRATRLFQPTRMCRKLASAAHVVLEFTRQPGRMRASSSTTRGCRPLADDRPKSFWA